MLGEILYPYVGTAVNFAAVLILGILGALVKKGIPGKISNGVMQAIAVCVIYIGVQGVLEAAPDTSATAPSISPELFKVLVMVISMTVGTLIGELIDFEKWMSRIGETVSKKVGTLGGDGFAKGFVSASILFCVGAMTVNGAMASAAGDHQIFFTKAVIDGVAVFVMSSTLGIGCAFSAFFILIYQGALTLFGTVLVGALSASAVTYMSVTGSLIIILLGMNVLGVTKVRTANMVPAMFVAVAVEYVLKLIF